MIKKIWRWIIDSILVEKERRLLLIIIILFCVGCSSTPVVYDRPRMQDFQNPEAYFISDCN